MSGVVNGAPRDAMPNLRRKDVSHRKYGESFLLADPHLERNSKGDPSGTESVHRRSGAQAERSTWPWFPYRFAGGRTAAIHSIGEIAPLVGCALGSLREAPFVSERFRAGSGI